MKLYNLLSTVLVDKRFQNRNFLEEVKDSPILSETMILRNVLEKEVWDKLAYTPPLSLIMDATDDLINEMVEKLVVICQRKSLFDVISPNIDIYPMLKSSRILSLKRMRGLEKTRSFVELLSEMVNYDDDHKDTRRVSISIMLKTFANGDENDEYTFMIGNGANNDMDDYNIDTIFWDDDS